MADWSVDAIIPSISSTDPGTSDVLWKWKTVSRMLNRAALRTVFRWRASSVVSVSRIEKAFTTSDANSGSSVLTGSFDASKCRVMRPLASTPEAWSTTHREVRFCW